MERKRRLIIAKIAVVMGTIPLLIWAHSSGPDVGKSGVPGESTCMEAGCHLGSALNAGGGSVQVTFPGGMTYTPGVRQHLVVTVADPTARVWGFQLTARQSSNPRAMAGTFVSTDRFTAVVCGATPNDLAGEIFLDFGQNQNCPVNKPLAYAEHTSAGSSRSTSVSQTYEFDWTPPATNVGDIRIYVAGNAANGNGNETGDKIYTNSYTLTAAAAGPAPAIESAGVQNGASFQPGVVPNSWITIKGSNLSASTATWERAIVDGRLPTLLEGVSVDVGGRPAYIFFVSPGQINALAPDVGAGSMQVTVTKAGQTSAAVTANSSVLMPAFFLWPNSQAVATLHPAGTFAVKNGTFAGLTTTPAKPGDVIILWGTGMGPTNPAAPVGSVTSPTVLYSVTNSVTVTVGGATAEVFGAALAPGFVGLYQVAIQVPASAPNGDLPVVVTVGGAQSPAGVTLTVQR
jgi:uncharacterized protein (TIGR03437 family)